MGSEIRLGQLIAPFGPGGIYTDRNGVPNIICGLDWWHYRVDESGAPVESSKSINKSTIVEPRLSDLLRVSHFRQPPEYYYDRNNPDLELQLLKIQSHRFPRWYFNNTSGELKKFNYESTRIDRPGKGLWKPVRFITVCSSGHIDDFPWKRWIGCECDSENGLVLNDSGGVDLGSIKVRCKYCKKAKSMAGATHVDREERTSGLQKAGIEHCTGERPWLGRAGRERDCGDLMAGALINQSNVYFSRTISSIYLPDLESDESIREIQGVLEPLNITAASIAIRLGDIEGGLGLLRVVLEKKYTGSLPSDEDIMTAYASMGRGALGGAGFQKPECPESDLLTFRRSEFNILRNEVSAEDSSELTVIPSAVPGGLAKWFARINLVERLRETRVFYGFDRLERSDNPLEDMPDSALNQLFLNPPGSDISWLPAIKNYGEGIYIELAEEAINSWINENSDWLQKRYSPNFVGRMGNEALLLPPNSNIDWQWASRYQLVHTLSHVLINQLVFESGYSSAALKERLFVSSDKDAPMAGILIYTASGDSDGSLGGLVRMGRPALFEGVVRTAMSRASWCSADPVCSENLGGSGTRLVNMSACHACTLLPETACETINNGLDRSSLVGVPQNQNLGFFSELIL
jgi:hypothetical protein